MLTLSELRSTTFEPGRGKERGGSDSFGDESGDEERGGPMARVLYMATSAAEEGGGERFGCEVACGYCGG